MCGFRRRLSDEDESAEGSAVSIMPPDALLDNPPHFVALERGSHVHGTHRVARASARSGGPDQRQASSSSSTAAYSVSSCKTYNNWATFTAYIVWNSQNADDVYAKEILLDNFATNFGVNPFIL